MNGKLTFKERAEIGMKMLAKQKPVTLVEVRAQVKWLKEMSTSKLNEEQHKMIAESENDIKAGKIHSQTEMQKMIESWNEL